MGWNPRLCEKSDACAVRNAGLLPGNRRSNVPRCRNTRERVVDQLNVGLADILTFRNIGAVPDQLGIRPMADRQGFEIPIELTIEFAARNFKIVLYPQVNWRRGRDCP